MHSTPTPPTHHHGTSCKTMLATSGGPTTSASHQLDAPEPHPLNKKSLHGQHLLLAGQCLPAHLQHNTHPAVQSRCAMPLNRTRTEQQPACSLRPTCTTTSLSQVSLSQQVPHSCHQHVSMKHIFRERPCSCSSKTHLPKTKHPHSALHVILLVCGAMWEPTRGWVCTRKRSAMPIGVIQADTAAATTQPQHTHAGTTPS